jgi:hypothetical protein
MRLTMRLLVTCSLLLMALVAAPSDAATGRAVSLKSSRSAATVGSVFKLSGKVTHSPKGTAVAIQRRGSGAWKTLKTVKTTNRSGAYAWTAAKLTSPGTYSFRARVSKKAKLAAATSAIRKVTASYAPGSIQNPYAVGQSFALAGWRFSLDTTNTDAWPEIEAENQFNEAPVAGWSYVMVAVTFTNLGTGYDDPFFATDEKFVGSDGRVYGYTNSGGDCGVLPNDATEIGDLYANSSATANVCAVVPTQYISGGKWRVEGNDYGAYRHVRIS